MKKYLIYCLFPLLFLASCKKTYTCECYTTVVFEVESPNGRYFASVVVPGSKTPYSQKLTERQARSACQHEEAATESNFKNAFTNNGRAPLLPGESIKTSCGLK